MAAGSAGPCVIDEYRIMQACSYAYILHVFHVGAPADHTPAYESILKKNIGISDTTKRHIWWPLLVQHREAQQAFFLSFFFSPSQCPMNRQGFAFTCQSLGTQHNLSKESVRV